MTINQKLSVQAASVLVIAAGVAMWLAYNVGIYRGERNMLISGRGVTVDGWMNLGEERHHISVSSARIYYLDGQPIEEDGERAMALKPFIDEALK